VTAKHQRAYRRRSDAGSAAPDRLLDVDEAGALLGVRPKTLYQWAYQRRIPVVKLFGPRGALRFRLSDIEALIARFVRPALHEGLDTQ
jgi:excisionase family DNA binding protein